jgi:hypothetical protein
MQIGFTLGGHSHTFNPAYVAAKRDAIAANAATSAKPAPVASKGTRPALQTYDTINFIRSQTDSPRA